MHAVWSLGIGYLLGCISPAAMLSRRKNVNLKEEGTTNLGATNTALVLGTGSGIIVMIVDILKSVFSVKIAKWAFPQMAAAGMIAGIGCMVGHCFPVTNKFQGGKGLASYGGMVLAFSPKIFLAIASFGILLMTLLNTGVVVPMTASVIFPVLVYLKSRSISQTLAAIVAGMFLVGMHWGNLKKAIAGEDYISTRKFYKEHLFKKKK